MRVLERTSPGNGFRDGGSSGDVCAALLRAILMFTRHDLFKRALAGLSVATRAGSHALVL